ncbi:hypothetical protein [Streptomyces sp. NPDC051776]|uniref:hypothetical protein n=1 Tax=Streptomyces sp. NPDC051776 TaxID=3155414 RepID=UPI0034184E49
MRKVAAATAVVMALAGVTSFCAGIAFADERGGATAIGGSSTDVGLFQQNKVQEGRLNSACGQLSEAFLSPVGERTTGRCLNDDGSFNMSAHTGSKGAHVEGGSSGAFTVVQQNIAQKGRLNNACDDQNNVDPTLEGSRVDSDCHNKDRSSSKQVLAKSGGAHIEGGNSSGFSVQQQNIAQDGRQNNACTAQNNFGPTLEGSRMDSDCHNKDRSSSKQVLAKSGGAHIQGGNSGTSLLQQQNIAQDGRQNNACANPEDADFTLEGGRMDSECRNKDRSFSKKVLVKSGGADIEGGSSSVSVEQQNYAQGGRQNNACADHDDSEIAVTGGRVDSECRNKDRSFNNKVLVKSGGAHIEGGSSSVSSVEQQNYAQDGRQNNACATSNDADLTLDSGRIAAECGNSDSSFNKHVLVNGGGARAEGGSSTGSVFQYNTAQEGRQNNACANLNEPDTLEASGGRMTAECANKDRSFNKHVLVEGGAARAEGGGSGTGSVFQYNTAQEGRQNNACTNPNGGAVTLTGSRVESRCRTIDESMNLGTKEAVGGAEAQGGSSTADLFQQNTAQSGRQSNHCGNPNNLTLTATGSRVQSQCIATDSSTSIGTIQR